MMAKMIYNKINIVNLKLQTRKFTFKFLINKQNK